MIPREVQRLCLSASQDLCRPPLYTCHQILTEMLFEHAVATNLLGIVRLTIAELLLKCKTRLQIHSSWLLRL